MPFIIFVNQTQFLRLSSHQSLLSIFLQSNRRNRLNRLTFPLIRTWPQWIISSPHFPNYFVIRISRKHLKHFISVFIIFALSLQNQYHTINDLSLHTAIRIANFLIKDLKGSISRMIKLRRSTISMCSQIDKYLLHLLILGGSKSIYQILNPNICMIFNILPDQFIQIFTNNKSFIPNPIHYARNQYHIILFFMTVLRVKDDLDYFFGNTK